MPGAAAHALLEQAVHLADLQRLDAAIALVHRALATDPGDVTALTVLAYCLNRAGRLDEALAVTRQAAVLAPDDSQVFQLQARALLGLGRLREGIEAAREGHRLGPDEAQSNLTLAMALCAAGGTRGTLAAASAVARARELAPEDPEVHVLDGYLQFRMAEFGRARVAYHRALSLAPDDPAALYALAHLDIGRGRALPGAPTMGDTVRAAPTDDLVLRTATVSARRVLWSVTDRASLSLGVALIAVVLCREDIDGPAGVGSALAAVLVGVGATGAYLRHRLSRLPDQIRLLIRAELLRVTGLPAGLRLASMVIGMLLLALSRDPGADSGYEITANTLGFGPLMFLVAVRVPSRLCDEFGFVVKRLWYRLHGSHRSAA